VFFPTEKGFEMAPRTFLPAALLVALGSVLPIHHASGQPPIAVRHQSTDDSAMIQVASLKKPLVILHVSDTHISVRDNREADFWQYADRMDNAYGKPRAHFQTGQKALPAEHFRQLMAVAKAKRVDLIALTGDIVNNPSRSSIQYVSQALAETGIPSLYISGNHDWHYEGLPGSDAALRKQWSHQRLLPLYAGRDPMGYSVVVGGINFVAIDNSTYQVSDEQLALFEKEIARGLPTVLLVHIPIWTGKNVGRPASDSCGDPQWGCDADRTDKIERRERWAKQGNLKSTTAFVERVKTSPNLIAVLTGHTHRAKAEELSASAVQYVARAGCEGAYRLVTFQPLQNAPSANSAEPQAAASVVFNRSETWTPDPHATPHTSRSPDNEYVIEGNGTRTCCGGWQFVYGGVRGGQAYRLRAKVRHQRLENTRDSLVAIVLWGTWTPDASRSGTKPWNYLIPKFTASDSTDFEAVVKAPPDATVMTIRYAFRWSIHGKSQWSAPQIEETVATERQPVRVCVVTQTRQTRERIAVERFSQGSDLPADVAQSVDLWASLVKAACQRKPHLIVTPEIAVSGPRLVEGAVTVPGPATAPFERLAREHGVHLILGVRQREGDAIYNSAVLIGPPGKVLGIYHKVHLATGEGLSGTSPGNSFPVFDTSIGRIGCQICMDTTVCESARMLALQGADFICFPVMGDLRADRWSPGQPIFNEDRWKAIMRTRAIDNQLCMVVARNSAQGSCIIDRKGDILAWNEGDQEIIEATVPGADGYRMWDGGDFREITFLLRRPHLYQAYTDESRVAQPHP
jgi:predicted amidohydrolase/3',5'-cyclic AMP phosphodiesterase CpdA